MQALIKNNKVFCKVCEKHDYKVIDCKTVIKEGKQHTQVIARCICGTEFYFFTKIKVNSDDLHYVFDEETSETKENLEMNKGIRLCDRNDCTHNTDHSCSKEQIEIVDLLCNDFEEEMIPVDDSSTPS